jgi:hypothetical protein
MNMRLLAAIAMALIALATSANAQNFPDRPMTMVIPFAAGGPTDVLGRVIAGRMSEILGQQVIVENIGGAGGMTGSEHVAKAAPDGYQFVLGTVGTHAQGQTLYKHPLYNAATDFTPVIPGICLLCQGEPRADAVWLSRSGVGDASRLRAPQLPHRGRRHARSLPRNWTGDAGFAGRPHRLSV